MCICFALPHCEDILYITWEAHCKILLPFEGGQQIYRNIVVIVEIRATACLDLMLLLNFNIFFYLGLVFLP